MPLHVQYHVRQVIFHIAYMQGGEKKIVTCSLSCLTREQWKRADQTPFLNVDYCNSAHTAYPLYIHLLEPLSLSVSNNLKNGSFPCLIMYLHRLIYLRYFVCSKMVGMCFLIMIFYFFEPLWLSAATVALFSHFCFRNTRYRLHVLSFPIATTCYRELAFGCSSVRT